MYLHVISFIRRNTNSYFFTILLSKVRMVTTTKFAINFYAILQPRHLAS